MNNVSWDAIVYLIIVPKIQTLCYIKLFKPIYQKNILLICADNEIFLLDFEWKHQ